MTSSRKTVLAVLRDALAQMTVFEGIGLQVNSGYYEDWSKRLLGCFSDQFGAESSYCLQLTSLIDGVKRRVELGMNGDIGMQSLNVETRSLIQKAIDELIEATPAAVRGVSLAPDSPESGNDGPSELLKNSALIAKYMLDKGFLHEKWVNISDLMDGIGMESTNFRPADSYLLQKEEILSIVVDGKVSVSDRCSSFRGAKYHPDPDRLL